MNFYILIRNKRVIWGCFAQTLLLVLCLHGSVSAQSLGAPSKGAPAIKNNSPRAADQIYFIPFVNEGQTTMLQTRICRPSGDAPARLVVINHGSPPDPSDRPHMRPGQCNQESARWFLTRGYVVAFPVRRGYGDTGGTWAESYGSCSNPDYVSAGLETAKDIDTVVKYITALPFVLPDGAVVVGQSAGGWGTIAYDSMPHPRVAAFIVMAGGRGGHKDRMPNTNCSPESLVRAAGRYGATARTPMVWIYTMNDSFFAPPLARAMHNAFISTGGVADLVQLGPYDREGHHLFSGDGASLIWGPIFDEYLAARLKPVQ